SWAVARREVTGTCVATARPQHLFTTAAAEIHPVLRTAGTVGAIAELRRDVGVVVAHALPMDRIVRPVVVDVDIVDVDRTVDEDVVAAPVHAAAPAIAA